MLFVRFFKAQKCSARLLSKISYSFPEVKTYFGTLTIGLQDSKVFNAIGLNECE